jgi:hypothetical protein
LKNRPIKYAVVSPYFGKKVKKTICAKYCWKEKQDKIRLWGNKKEEGNIRS